MGYLRTNTLFDWVGESSQPNDDGEIVVSEQNQSAIFQFYLWVNFKLYES